MSLINTSRDIRIVFFDPEISGHHLDYIKHLCLHSNIINRKIKMLFVVHPEAPDQFAWVINRLEPRQRRKIFFLPLSSNEHKLCTTGSLSKRAFRKWKLMLNYIKLTDARHGHFLHLDHIQLPLALQFKPLNGATISGILFLPSIHYRHYWKTKFTISEKLTNFRKRIFYSAMLSNSCLRVIFSLDPYFQRYALTHLPHGRKICELPDPSLFPVEKLISKKALPAHFQSIPNSRKIFLIFGMLDKRKGIFKVLEAMNYLDDITLKKIAIIFAGRLAHSIREEFYQIFEETSYRIKALHLQLEDRYIPEEELIQTIRASDVILAPYQRFTGSSGILLWAAGANKPIITQDHGVIGALTKKYKLGLSIDTTDPKEVANALTSIIESDLIDVGDKSKMNNFVANKSSKTFAYTILRKILNEIPETKN